ncbi:GntR family transcriptional regulator [Intrasporangium sp.]|uniref:GntR family transcriptional regulator n=1 Tax=Intrasporangium sp. TaxID=1925024 RepID=UPI0032216AA8
MSGASRIDVGVDLEAAEPPFEQVRDQITRLIAAGRLLPGDRLPTVRGLAAELGLAVNTVARSYKELEAVGLVETGGRAGTVVATNERTAHVAAATLASRFAVAARSAGLADDEAVDLVRVALREAPST